MKKYIFRPIFKTISSCVLAMAISACSSNNTAAPELPETPNHNEGTNEETEVIEAQIGYSFESYETPLSRAGNSDDLIGIDIAVLQNGNPQTYAWGVFDDVSQLKAKFVKGYKYRISLNYFPNAKNVVYNYPNGTFGSPFSYIYDAHDYNLNEVNYFSGNYNDGPTGDNAAFLVNMFGNLVQNTSADLNREFILGTHQRYLGQTDFIEINESGVNVELENYMMAIRLDVANFTSGKIRMTLDNHSFEFNPSDDLEVLFQIPYKNGLRTDSYVGGSFSTGGIKVYYDSDSGESWLLATTGIECKKNTRITYKFNLEEREDGSIGIIIKDNEPMTEEEDFFQ